MQVQVWARASVGAGAGTTGAAGNGASAAEKKALVEGRAREKLDRMWSLPPTALGPCCSSSEVFLVGGLCTILSLSRDQSAAILACSTADVRLAECGWQSADTWR
eukprot:2217947-Pleurochrysis_carterae.AAC.7